MKHVSKMTKNTPAKAQVLPEDHPSITESAKGLFADPVGVVTQHLQKG